MSEASQKMHQLKEEEEALSFNVFSRDHALQLGLIMLENAKKYVVPVAIEITINGLSVFRYFMDGSIKDSALWLERKRNSVELMSMSSLQFMYWLEDFGESLEQRKVNPNDYAVGGGGFPIRIKGMDVVGSICVSGLPNHFDDHQLVVDSIKSFLEVE